MSSALNRIIGLALGIPSLELTKTETGYTPPPSEREGEPVLEFIDPPPNPDETVLPQGYVPTWVQREPS